MLAVFYKDLATLQIVLKPGGKKKSPGTVTREVLRMPGNHHVVPM